MIPLRSVLSGLGIDAPPNVAPAAPPRLTALLPHGRWSARHGLFALAAGGEPSCIGFCLEMPPQTGASDAMVALLEDMVSSLPGGACFQAALYADPDIRPCLDAYARAHAAPGAADIHAELARRRRRHLSRTPLLREAPSYRLRDFRLFVSVAVRGSLGRGRDVEAALQLRQSVKGALGSAGFPSADIDGPRMAELLASLLVPFGRRWQRPFDSAAPVRDQAGDPGVSYRVREERIDAQADGETVALVAMSVNSYPREACLQGMGGIVGDFLHETLAYECPFLLAMSLAVGDYEKERQRSELRTARAVQNASSVMARLMPGHYERQREDWSLASSVLKNGGMLSLLSHHVVLYASPARVAAAAEAARAVWRAHGFALSPSRYMQIQNLFAALPLGLTPALARDLRLAGWMRRMTHHNAVRMAPLLAEWKGTRTPAMLLCGRRGQVMPLDFFDNDSGNFNVIVAGTSGSGKSMFLNEVAASYLAGGAQVWIIDIGRSYEKLCRLLGGEFLEFGVEAAPLCLNPFASVNRIETDMELLEPLLALMISPGRTLPEYQRACLQAAIKLAWRRHGRRADPGALRDALLAGEDGNDPRVRDMAVMLYPYTAEGAWGPLFSGGSAAGFGGGLTVIELEELQARRDLQAIVLFMLMYRISQAMYHDRSRRKLVIIDEAWDLMRSPAAADFIEHGYRRARKYNGAFLSAAQSIADFHANAAALAALDNSDWCILMRQKAERIRQLSGENRLALGEGEKRMLLSLCTRRGCYSEMLVRSEQGTGIGRLIVDPFARTLYSSTSEDYEAIRRLVAAGIPLAEAIERVADDRA